MIDFDNTELVHPYRLVLQYHHGKPLKYPIQAVNLVGYHPVVAEGLPKGYSIKGEAKT